MMINNDASNSKTNNNDNISFIIIMNVVDKFTVHTMIITNITDAFH